MVLTSYSVLSPVTGLFCHRRRRTCLRRLDASVGASEPHVFTVRKKRPRQKRLPRPPHPASNVRDDRETPLRRERDHIGILLIWPRRQAIFRKFRNYLQPRRWGNRRPK